MTKTTLALFLKLASSGDLLSTGVHAVMAKAAQAVPARKPYPGPLNNPMNLRKTDVKWYGERRTGRANGQFASFNTADNGLRAGMRNAMNKLDGMRRPTIPALLSRLSPANENNVVQHSNNVSAISGIPLDRILDTRNTGQMVDLARGITQAESGEAAARSFTPHAYTNAILRARRSL